MIVVSENRENLAVSFSKLEAEDLHILCDQLLNLDFSGGEDESRMEKFVDKLYDILDKYLERNGNPANCLIP